MRDRTDHISQTVYIEDKNGHVKQFDHSFYLQSYTREARYLFLPKAALKFYKNTEAGKEPWREGDGMWIAEAGSPEIKGSLKLPLEPYNQPTFFLL